MWDPWFTSFKYVVHCHFSLCMCQCGHYNMYSNVVLASFSATMQLHQCCTRSGAPTNRSLLICIARPHIDTYLHKKISTLCRGSCSVFTFTAKTSIRQTKCTAPSTNHCHRDGGTVGARGRGKQGAARPPQILVDQLTLSQPGGIDYTHQITNQWSPLRFSDLPPPAVMRLALSAP